ncbi:M1 family peptidase [Aurantiacibacter xanthus]|uniref:Aminopeptidase N n=1 Tax=Aurantiacibacter xanthus TaxID=1784712 RepID=A0A3A1P3B5_9SPHN|nr:M1 family metallopeptidase [Aurantiacibacter xanthus]RIV84449.1 M1 family peptidase [Aurantiacibacter xanthus]
MRLSCSAALLAFALTACSTSDGPADEHLVAPILTSAEAQDEYTWARPTEARVTHVSLDLALDFAAQQVGGTATLDIVAADDAREIVLDSNGLQVSAVTDGAGEPLKFTLGENADGSEKGEPFTITFAEDSGAVTAPEQIVVTYKSAPGAEALQWLSPEQTAGKKHPFLFSQGQAILNRSWIPTQDSPGIRQSWDARIAAPAALGVVMSGIRRGDAESGPDGTKIYTFEMEHSVPPYLISIAAGDIAFAQLGPRTGVWAEPSVLEAAKEELGDTEAMIDAAESIYGDYRWGRYDMIVLPPSFPYGGMENPVMTFLTPTFIAGDRSNTGLVAHELAHSWSGNLVTYASWRDGWLNEGVTSYIENRITEKVFGELRAEQEYALSYAALVGMIEQEGENSPVTAMRTPPGTSPFDTASEAIYDKGTVFLRTVESIVGREKFDPWLRNWFDSHAFQPATSEMFLADMRENLLKGDKALEDKLMLDEWVYGTGLPGNALKPDPKAFAAVDAAVAAYADSRDLTAIEAEWPKWSAAEQRRFLERLPEELSPSELAGLDTTLGLSGTRNAEVQFLWLDAALRNRYQPVVPQAEEFLTRVGRNKFVSPLYAQLMAQDEWGQAIARALYARTRGGYHSMTRGSVDRIVGWTE